MKSQLEILPEYLNVFNLPVIGIDTWEADDVIASIVHKFANLSLDVKIVGVDKDYRQLLTRNVSILDLISRTEFTVDSLQKTWEISPSLVTTYLALVGDSADNIPGVPGIGHKRALEIIKKYGCFEKIISSEI